MKKIIIIILFILSIFGIIYSSFKIINWKHDTKKNKNIKEEIDSNIIIKETDENIEYNIDFQSLEEINSDIVAYIKVKNTNIDNVIVKGNDNSFYLNHNLNKEGNVAGWLFIDYHNRLDDKDKNIVIYGHDMKDGSMFGTLNKVLDENWYLNKDNYIIDFITKDKVYHYQVFSTYTIPVEDYYNNTIFNNDIEFFNFLKVIKERSIFNYQIEINEDDKILTLSSCIGNGNKRVVLHAKLIS